MPRNYLRTALRSMRRHPGHSFINVFGLSVGLTACMIILVYVVHETGYDRAWPDADRIFRVTALQTSEEGARRRAQAPTRLVPALRSEVPGVEAVATVQSWPERVVSAGGNTFVDTGCIESDGSLFELLGIDFASGDAASALQAPYSVVLTEGYARRLFRDADPVGRDVGIDRKSYRVTGVVPDPPRTTHLQYRFVVSAASRRALFGDETIDEIESNWRVGIGTYLKLSPGADPARVEETMDRLAAQRIDEPDLAVEFDLVRLPDVHLQSDGLFGLLLDERPGDPARIALLAAIALFILLLACVNFVNLATARATTRAREVGIRKVSGAGRRQLVAQFTGEALVTSLLSLAVALAAAGLLIPLFSTLVDVDLASDPLSAPPVVAGMLALAILTGILAGLYPAFVLSSARPAIVLKGGRSGAGSGRLRRALVVFQFVVSIALIAGTLVVRGQLDFIRHRDLGYDTEQVVVLRVRDTAGMAERYDPFKRELLALPGVVSVSASTSIGALGAQTPFGTEPEDERLDFGWVGVDFDFVRTTGLDLVAGRDLSADMPNDASGAFLLNEKAASELGFWAETALGQTLRYNRREARVVGVVRDFHQGSLYDAVEPMVLYHLPARSLPFVVVRLGPGDLASTLAGLGATWSRFMPDLPFEYTFLDERIQRFYEDDRRFARIFETASAIAVAIACLGLVGLAAFAAERRRKEIGVRKVLGAGVSGILVMISREFVVLTLIAFVVAAPLARVGLDAWLERFAYRFTPGPGLFLVAGGLALVVAVASVGVQAWRAATADPVRVLRSE